MYFSSARLCEVTHCLLSSFQKSQIRGFTLVEILVVVAIIGIIGTIGIPTWRRMVQKSKQSEAKVGLASIFTCEAAFAATFGAYGNHVTKVGLDIDGSHLLYLQGFAEDDCGSKLNLIPDGASDIGISLRADLPGYYMADPALIINGIIYHGVAPFTTIGRPAQPNSSKCYISDVAPDAGSYVAGATGCIAPGCMFDSPLGTKFQATPGNPVQDVWTIDNARLLQNIGDGVSPF